MLLFISSESCHGGWTATDVNDAASRTRLGTIQHSVMCCRCIRSSRANDTDNLYLINAKIQRDEGYRRPHLILRGVRVSFRWGNAVHCLSLDFVLNYIPFQNPDI